MNQINNIFRRWHCQVLITNQLRVFTHKHWPFEYKLVRTVREQHIFSLIPIFQFTLESSIKCFVSGSLGEQPDSAVNRKVLEPMKVKEESEKVVLKLNIQKTKIMASGPITSWQIDGETMTDFIFSASNITAHDDYSHKV